MLLSPDRLSQRCTRRHPRPGRGTQLGRSDRAPAPFVERFGRDAARPPPPARLASLPAWTPGAWRSTVTLKCTGFPVAERRTRWRWRAWKRKLIFAPAPSAAHALRPVDPGSRQRPLVEPERRPFVASSSTAEQPAYGKNASARIPPPTIRSIYVPHAIRHVGTPGPCTCGRR